MGPLRHRLRRFDVLLPAAQLGLYIFLLTVSSARHGTSNVAWDSIEPLGRRLAFGLNTPALVAALAVIDLFGLRHDKVLEILTGVFLVILWNRVGRWLDDVFMSLPNRSRPRPVTWKRMLAALALIAIIIADVNAWYDFIASHRDYPLQNLLRNSPELIFAQLLWPSFLCVVLARTLRHPSVVATVGLPER